MITLIAKEVERRGWHPNLATWIDNLCTGVEDPSRLRCCHSGCFVCKNDVLRIVELVKAKRDDA